MNLDPTVFEEAANYIDEYGWWGGGSGTTNESTCIANALWNVLHGQVHTLVIAKYQDALMRQLACTTLFEVFELNDSQPLEDGKEWAVTNLREVAEYVRARV